MVAWARQQQRWQRSDSESLLKVKQIGFACNLDGRSERKRKQGRPHPVVREPRQDVLLLNSLDPHCKLVITSLQMRKQRHRENTEAHFGSNRASLKHLEMQYVMMS